jgi:hypothetical protein
MIERYLHLRVSYRTAALANVKPICPMVMPSTSGSRFGRLIFARPLRRGRAAFFFRLAALQQ